MMNVRPLLAVLLALALSACSSTTAAPTGTQAVELEGRTFHLELALDSQARHQGLSDRESIAADGGMLFVFPDVGVRSFVMRRCLVPIDIIFLGPSGRIVAMHEMQVEPYDTPEDELRRYSSRWPAQFAIELAGGTLDQLGLEEGQIVELPLDDLKRRAR